MTNHLMSIEELLASVQYFGEDPPPYSPPNEYYPQPAYPAWPPPQPCYPSPDYMQPPPPQPCYPAQTYLPPEPSPFPLYKEPPPYQEPPAEPPQPELPAKPIKKTMTLISNIIFWVICVSLIGGSTIFALSNNPNKSYFGFRFYSVLTQSMSPKADGSSPPGGFYKGDIIIVKLSEPEEIAAGDIITFNPNMRDTEGKAYLTHRVVEVLNEMDGEDGIHFITKGDFNDSEDPPISGHMLIGKKVFTIPKMGTVLQLLRDNFILAIVTIVCLFGCIIMLKWYFAKPKEEEVNEVETVQIA